MDEYKRKLLAVNQSLLQIGLQDIAVRNACKTNHILAISFFW